MGRTSYGGNSHIEWVGLESNLLATSKNEICRGCALGEKYTYLYFWMDYTYSCD